MTGVQCPVQLRDLYLAGRLIPFIGAGISAGVRWEDHEGAHSGPSWHELVDKAAELVGFSEPELLRARGNDLQILEYFRAKKHNETGELTKWLTKALNPPGTVLRESPVHRRLAQLDRSNLLYTTNYDSFIEDAFELHGREWRRIVTEGDIADSVTAAAAGARPCEIVKFHGDLMHPRAMVLSERDYESRLRLTEPLDHKLRHDLLGRAVLFLGYSFRDWNVAYLFRLLNDERGALPGSTGGRRAFIAVADPSDFETTLFAERNIEVIPISGTRRAEDIASLLDQLIEAPRV